MGLFRNILNNLSRRDAIVLSVMVVVFIVLCVRYLWFVLDDAFITMRYAKHLAEGHGIVWNVSGDPVEGVTSLLWLLIAAIPHWLQLPPLFFVDLVSICAGIAVIVSVYVYGVKIGASRHLVIGSASLVAVNPALAVLTVQGLETTVTMLFPLASSILSIKISRDFSPRTALILSVSLVLGVLARPGLGMFAAGLFVSLCYHLYSESGRNTLLRFLLYGLPLPVVGAAVFVFGRWAYFGYPFPNTFYVKEAGGIISTIGLQYLADFLSIFIGYIIALGIVETLQSGISRERFRCILPSVWGISAFLLLWLFITPAQGFFWRFQMPVLPAILIVVLYSSASTGERDRWSVNLGLTTDVRLTHLLLSVLLLSTLFLYPLHTLDEAEVNVEGRDHRPRAEVGEALHPLADEGYKMFVTESGAIPYYSEWAAVDELGLNSERIAHDGLDKSFLRSYDPDLIILQSGLINRPLEKKYPETASYLNTSDYRLVTVIENNNAYLYILVNRKSPGYRSISCELLTIDGAQYLSAEKVEPLIETDVGVSSLTKSKCIVDHNTTAE